MAYNWRYPTLARLPQYVQRPTSLFAALRKPTASTWNPAAGGNTPKIVRLSNRVRAGAAYFPFPKF